MGCLLSKAGDVPSVTVMVKAKCPSECCARQKFTLQMTEEDVKVFIRGIHDGKKLTVV